MADENRDGLAARSVPVAASVARSPVSIDRAVEEGLMIARAALTMEVKNHIIVGAIGEGRSYDPHYVAKLVRGEVRELARENEENARRLEKLAADVLTARGARPNSEGYQAADHPALTDRAAIHHRMSAELTSLSDDDTYLAEIADAARARAWAEVGDAIESRLLHSLPKPPDRFYDDDKEARIRALYNINLKALERQAKRSGHFKEY